MTDIIKFKGVSKVYKSNIIALNDVTFSAPKGQFFFVIGPSGAGKSTLIKLLIREEYPTDGQILFDKIAVTDIPRKMLSLYRQQLGVVFQDLNLIPSKTVSENIGFVMEILRKPKKDIRERTDELLELVGLQDRSDLFPDDLSGGEQQKVGIARALANRPQLFIADEPTGNLDPSTSLEILSLLQKINDEGTTVMVVSHDKEIVNSAKTRVLLMDKGTIIKDYTGGYIEQEPKKGKESGEDKKKSKLKT